MNPKKQTWNEAQRRLWACPVSSLQLMLRRLSERFPFLPRLTVDGVFGPKTLEAVMLYQKYRLPPVTGIVDQRTWSAIRDEWSGMERSAAQAAWLRGVPERFEVDIGERAGFLYLVQAMFQSLSGILEGVEEERVDGIHSGNSVENTLWLQRAAGLEETGRMDERTWDALARLYELLVVDAAELPERKKK